MPHCILLIRHGEKPRLDDHGIDEWGRQDGNSLSVRGWQRAGGIVPYFSALAERLHPGVLCRPQYIIAARSTEAHPSTRPQQTVDELANRLGISVDLRWSEQDSVAKLALHLKSLDGPVLVCWRHGQLPDLARAIYPGDDLPDTWPNDRFDLVWSLRCDQGSWRFMQVPQLLLAGDRFTPIDWRPSVQNPENMEP